MEGIDPFSSYGWTDHTHTLLARSDTIGAEQKTVQACMRARTQETIIALY
jgi:hypothetical protein